MLYLPGRDEIRQIVNSLHVGGGDSIIDMAHRFYKVCVFVITQRLSFLKWYDNHDIDISSCSSVASC